MIMDPVTVLPEATVRLLQEPRFNEPSISKFKLKSVTLGAFKPN